MSCKLELRDISFAAGGNTILNGVSLTLEPGSVATFGGCSGSGKSALLEICAGLLKPAGGSVLWNGETINGMPRYDLYARRKDLGYVFQTHALISNHSVLDNIALPLKCGTNLSAKEIAERARAQMDELGVSRALEKSFPEALSAAQLRCAALARALVNRPKLLILDEPLSRVDPFTAQKIITVLHERWKRDGMTVFMATHSIRAWPEWSAGRYMLQGGRLEPAGAAFAKAANIRYYQKFNYDEGNEESNDG